MDNLRDFYNHWKQRYCFNEDDIIEDSDGTITHIYGEFGDVYFCIIGPHEGNNFQYILRINPKQTMDRWINADIEEFYDTIGELSEDLEHHSWIYKALMNIYITRYLEELGK